MKNILIVSNNDMCRSRMAQEILNSFGRGMKISTAGILAGNSVPDVVCQVMEQNGYDFRVESPVTLRRMPNRRGIMSLPFVRKRRKCKRKCRG